MKTADLIESQISEIREKFGYGNKERKQYYQDYLEVSANYLILCR